MQCAAHSLNDNMGVVNHIIGVIKLLLLLFLIFLIAKLSPVMAVLSTIVGVIIRPDSCFLRSNYCTEIHQLQRPKRKTLETRSTA